MNRKMLMAQLKSLGFKGDETLAAVEQFVADYADGAGLELTYRGSRVDFKSAFNTAPKGKKVVVGVVADAGEDVEITHGRTGAADNGEGDEANGNGESDADEPDGKNYNLREARREDAARRAGNGEKFNRGMAGILAAGKGPLFSDNYERKQYERKIRDGRAVFTDPDQAAFFGSYMRLVSAKQAKVESYSRKVQDLEIAGKAFASSVNTLGGALVPEEIANIVIDDAEKYGAARKLANVVQMSRDTYTGPRWTTDLAMSHLTENGSITAADPGTDSVSLTAKKVGCLSLLSNEVLEDSAFAVADLYAKSGARAIAYREDLDYIRGDGSSTYGGHVGLFGAVTSVAQGTSNTWATQVGADFDNMIGRIENFNNSNELAFLCSRQYYYQVMRRLDNATSQFRELSGQGQEIETGMFKGWPVVFSPVMPTATATTGITCFFGCFKAASMLGIRKELSVATSSDYAFNADQLAIRMIARIAVNIHGDGRASTYGPVTALKTG